MFVRLPPLALDPMLLVWLSGFYPPDIESAGGWDEWVRQWSNRPPSTSNWVWFRGYFSVEAVRDRLQSFQLEVNEVPEGSGGHPGQGDEGGVATPTSHDGRPVLVVDDDPAVLDAVRKTLERAGYNVRTATGGEGAKLEVVRSRPHLILTDLLMPDVDGVELILFLRQIAPRTPIIAMTGGGRVGVELLLDTAGALGAVQTLPKPFETQQLLEAVASAWP